MNVTLLPEKRMKMQELLPNTDISYISNPMLSSTCKINDNPEMTYATSQTEYECNKDELKEIEKMYGIR